MFAPEPELGPELVNPIGKSFSSLVYVFLLWHNHVVGLVIGMNTIYLEGNGGWFKSCFT